MTELLLEELFEKRDFYLYTLKHLEFRKFDDDSNETSKLMDITLNELRNIELEIRRILNENN